MVTAVEDRWQTKIKSISDGIQYIYESEEFSDVTFLVRGKPVKAHKLIVASRSSKLARTVMSHADTDEIIVPQTVTENGFRIFLRFLYTNKLQYGNKKTLVEVYLCAKYYEQKALESKCLEEMQSWVIDVKDACELLEGEGDVPNLREKCLSFIRENGLIVVASEAFAKANERAMAAILASDALADVPVLQFIESVMSWGKHFFSIIDADYSPVRQKLLNFDPPLLGKLRIENLQIEQFPTILQNYPKLLTDQEISQLVLYYGTRNRVHLPDWCTDKSHKLHPDHQ